MTQPKYKLLCMTFDGNFVTEMQVFNTVQEAWKHDNDMGSRWYFYPFHFVVTESVKTIVESCYLLDKCNGMRVKTIKTIFKDAAEAHENKNVDCELFALYLNSYLFMLKD